MACQIFRVPREVTKLLLGHVGLHILAQLHDLVSGCGRGEVQLLIEAHGHLPRLVRLRPHSLIIQAHIIFQTLLNLEHIILKPCEG